jgi:hypothetical protein
MTNTKRYGVGSLEEEIRKVRKMVFEGHDFGAADVIEEEIDPEENRDQLDEANTIRIKKSKDSIIGGNATVKMSVKGGKLEFTLAYQGPGAGNKVETVDIKKLARMVA